MEHDSVWLATAERPGFAILDTSRDADLTVDVAVVGGGIVGLTTALLAQRRGRRVAVLEAATVGGGTTGYTTGKVTAQHGVIYADLVKRLGEENARRYADAMRAGVEKVADLVSELEIGCDLTRAPAVAYTRSPEQRSRIEDEAEAAARLGLPARATDRTDLPVDVEAAVAFDDQLHFHPSRYMAGLAAAFTAAGGRIFEGARVTAIDEQPDRTVEVATSAATVAANQVVVATLLPPGLLGGYFARTRPSRSYGLAARLHDPAPTSMTIGIDAPTYSTRPWLDPGPNGLIVVGNGHETGAEPDTRAMYTDLETWTRATFDVEAIDYRWSAQDYTTPDRVPYVGRSPGSEQVLVATGFQKWGLSSGTAAAMMLADILDGSENPWLPVFDAARIGDARAIGRLIKDNLKVGRELIAGRRHDPEVRSLSDLRPGEGGLVDVGGHTVGGYRDQVGAVHTVSARCSHLGCPLHWNAAEASWDCTCHGSRFSPDGSVLDGPAVKPLVRPSTTDRSGVDLDPT
ncbi:FAD-dependent oxidoreductase [Nocardioides sp. NPDC057767]|uniref:FAD-dependent oxidoreductase n=1 Tax=unclassified Nocardioides TaxID=2615069 RepID=UPI00366A6ECF